MIKFSEKGGEGAMRKLSAAVCLSFFMFGAVHAEEAYDPQHTMLALNMAIVSINRILTTQDRTRPRMGI